MSQELERVYTINLGKVLLSPNNQRAKRAVNMVKEYARHHMKTEEIKIEETVQPTKEKKTPAVEEKPEPETKQIETSKEVKEEPTPKAKVSTPKAKVPTPKAKVPT